MTSQEVKDQYGFDPCHYTHIFYFHGVSFGQVGIKFLCLREHTNFYQFYRVDYTDLHRGVFLIKNVCDLDYVGSKDNSVLIIQHFRYFPENFDKKIAFRLMEHIITGQYIVVCEDRYSQLFFPYCKKTSVVGETALWGQ